VGAGHGKLLIQGGGGAPETYTRHGLDLCRGLNTRVVLIERAAGALDPTKQVDVELATGRWTRAGATDVAVLDFMDEAQAIAAVEVSDYIFFDGGDQSELTKWMKSAPAVMEAVVERHKEGALVGGMSAGAAAMSALMIIGGETADLTGVHAGGTKIGQGLAFWPEVITDQHFIKRQRFARLISAVLDHPAYPGIAIDEETAILVDRSGARFEVFGNGTVIVLDARRAKVGGAAEGEVQSGRGIQLDVLRAGDVFDLRKGR
jgi:cyanophycinase